MSVQAWENIVKQIEQESDAPKIAEHKWTRAAGQPDQAACAEGVFFPHLALDNPAR